MSNLVSVTKVATKGEKVALGIDEAVVEQIADQLALALVLSNDSVSGVLGRSDAKECFAYALKSILVQDSGAKPSYEIVPNFLSDITFSLSMLYRGVRISVEALESGKRPNSYESFLGVLSSLGIPTGRILKVDPCTTTNVLKLGFMDFNGTTMLVGADSEVSLEELVVRSMLAIPQQEEDKISRIVGHMDNLYVSRDELTRQWALTLPVGKR